MLAARGLDALCTVGASPTRVAARRNMFALDLINNDVLKTLILLALSRLGTVSMKTSLSTDGYKQTIIFGLCAPK